MKIKFSENIRMLRKEKHLTQEQLAEAMGVTSGAIYKWEQDLSTPDICLIMELASFFGVSVDALVGYEVCASDKDRIVQALKQIKLKKNYENCWNDIEGWLRRYPNDFDIVYNSGLLYSLASIETKKSSRLSRSIALMKHACSLLDQNKDPAISETSIYIDMAISYMSMGKIEEGLELLKTHNPCGINDDLIGQELAAHPNHREESYPYLSSALLKITTRLFRTVVGFLNIFFAKENYTDAIDMLQWTISYINGLRTEKGSSYLDKDVSLLLLICGTVYSKVGQTENAKDCLRKAREIAMKFDAAPNYTSQNIRYCESFEPQVAYDDLGPTAMDAILCFLKEDAESPEEPALQLWEEICHES